MGDMYLCIHFRGIGLSILFDYLIPYQKCITIHYKLLHPSSCYYHPVIIILKCRKRTLFSASVVLDEFIGKCIKQLEEMDAQKLATTLTTFTDRLVLHVLNDCMVNMFLCILQN